MKKLAGEVLFREWFVVRDGVPLLCQKIGGMGLTYVLSWEFWDPSRPHAARMAQYEWLPDSLDVETVSPCKECLDVLAPVPLPQWGHRFEPWHGCFCVPFPEESS